ncbi:MAG: hypothetical protein HWQ35_25465 [Nostoc sp. NMS1]|nr:MULTISPECIES: hypothetical protein [unclassified Nostoc]MBN3909762.1 hypothetical protein [Nostoc sp. NMS1]MBN3994919.1 hypothetical protein [Nostoc sp. NMS2]
MKYRIKYEEISVLPDSGEDEYFLIAMSGDKPLCIYARSDEIHNAWERH